MESVKSEIDKKESQDWLSRYKMIVILLAFAGLFITVSLFMAIEISPYLADLGKYGYFGVFALGLLVNATVVIPVPVLVTPILTGLALQYDPFSIAVVYAFGATIGESVSYGGSVLVAKIIKILAILKGRIMPNNHFSSQAAELFGRYSGLDALKKEQNRKYGIYRKIKNWNERNVRRWLKKYGGLAISVLALQPLLPFDVAGIIAGAAKYPYYKFLSSAF